MCRLSDESTHLIVKQSVRGGIDPRVALPAGQGPFKFLPQLPAEPGLAHGDDDIDAGREAKVAEGSERVNRVEREGCILAWRKHVGIQVRFGKLCDPIR